MKRFLVWMLTAALLLPLALTMSACSPQEDDPLPSTPSDDPNTPSEEIPETPADEPDNQPADEPVDDGYADTQSDITDYLNVFGRTPVKNGGLTMFWTNSGFSFAFCGTGVKANINTSTTNGTYYGYLNVYIDGATTPTSTICIDKNGTYTLAADLPNGDHTIEVRKRNEAIYGDSATLTLKKLTVTDGRFNKTPPKAPKYTIEFIGDSITSGFGNMVTDGGGAGANFSTHTQDGTMTYATMAARASDCNASVLSRSGICYVTGADRDSIYPYYVNTANLPGNGADATDWDFDAHPVDLIVINLGTNDTGARIDGKPISAAQYQTLAYNFLRLVRVNNPDATIIWAYGMITHSGGDPIQAAVEQCNDEGDDEIYYCPLPTMNSTNEGVGVHGHPDYLSHLISAVALTDFLEENTFLYVDYTPMLRDAVLIAQQYLDNSADILLDAEDLLNNGGDSEQAKQAIQEIIDACTTAFRGK